MKSYELTLAAKLLKQASHVFGNHGCNDVDTEMVNHISEEEKIELEQGFNRWNCPSGEPDQYCPFSSIPDFALMSYMGHRLREGEQ